MVMTHLTVATVSKRMFIYSEYVEYVQNLNNMLWKNQHSQRDAINYSLFFVLFCFLAVKHKKNKCIEGKQSLKSWKQLTKERKKHLRSTSSCYRPILKQQFTKQQKEKKLFFTFMQDIIMI